MSSSDPRYLLFAAFVALLLPFVPSGRFRLATLVLVSLIFYASFSPWYLLILAFVTISTFSLALVFSAGGAERLRRPTFVLSIIIALLPLLSFKYLGGMLSDQLPTQPAWLSLLNAALPVGLSFYTFQAVGYLIDVYVGNLEPERDAVRFSAFMSFFPQLLAGPIERAPHLLPQLGQLGNFDYTRVVAGIRAILIGLFLKVAVADSLAPLVDSVYSDPRSFSSPDLALATIYFSFEVYADFAGYSLIAIGSARLLGIELLQNFAQPFLSQTLPEYWRTWHISLSSWFRDYVFTPLQFQWRRKGATGLALALIITFTIVGIWHGSGWKYAIFGFMHGLLVSYSTLTFRARDRAWRKSGVPMNLVAVWRAIATFFTVTLTFVLFRADDVATAGWIYGQLLTGPIRGITLPVLWPSALIAIVIAGDLLARHRAKLLEESSPLMRWAIYHVATLTVLSAMLLHFIQGAQHVRQFIYYKF